MHSTLHIQQSEFPVFLYNLLCASRCNSIKTRTAECIRVQFTSYVIRLHNTRVVCDRIVQHRPPSHIITPPGIGFLIRFGLRIVHSHHHRTCCSCPINNNRCSLVPIVSRRHSDRYIIIIYITYNIIAAVRHYFENWNPLRFA